MRADLLFPFQVLTVRAPYVPSSRNSLRIVLAIGLWLVTATGVAHAHPGRLGRPVTWTDWNFDPVLSIVLALGTWTYLRGVLRLRRRKGAACLVNRRHLGAFIMGMLCLAVALLSPLDLLSEQLAWGHMVQHMLLMTVAAPLIILGAPLPIWLWGLSPANRRMTIWLWRRGQNWPIPWKLLWQPVLPWTLFAVAIWVWHLPVLYQAALRQPVVHDLQHLTFFGTACLFWRPLLDPLSRFRIDGVTASVMLFATTLHSTILGVLMTLAPTPWYPDYLGRTTWWGISPLEDQQLAGLIMWMPACFPYLVAAVVLLAREVSRRSNPHTGTIQQSLWRSTIESIPPRTSLPVEACGDALIPRRMAEILPSQQGKP